jgi:pimeloyl-ACP methyl ester carboxylesterase
LLNAIPTSEYRQRVASCQEFAREKGLDAILAYSDKRFSMGQGVESGQHVRYFVGFNFPPSRIHEDAVVLPYQIGQSLLVIPAEGDVSLIITRESVDLAKSQCWIKNILTTAKEYSDDKNEGLVRIAQYILGDLKKRTNQRIGISGKNNSNPLSAPAETVYWHYRTHNYAMQEQTNGWDVTSKLHMISVPTLIVQGDKDWVIPLEYAEILNQKIIGSRLEVFAGCGHSPQLEEKDRFVRIVNDFLNQNGLS